MDFENTILVLTNTVAKVFERRAWVCVLNTNPKITQSTALCWMKLNECVGGKSVYCLIVRTVTCIDVSTYWYSASLFICHFLFHRTNTALSHVHQPRPLNISLVRYRSQWAHLFGSTSISLSIRYAMPSHAISLPGKNDTKIRYTESNGAPTAHIAYQKHLRTSSPPYTVCAGVVYFVRVLYGWILFVVGKLGGLHRMPFSIVTFCCCCCCCCCVPLLVRLLYICCVE